jgi:hypothetical protein
MGVATAIAIGGLAVSGASTAMSFVQSSAQKGKQREAEAAAAAAMAAARKKLEINYAKERSIQKEPYELAREAMISSGAQAIRAGQESERGAETTAGKVQMAMNQGQADIRGTMGQELTDINKDIINENSRLRDLGVQLDLGEAEGAQLAARDAQEASTAAMSEGFQGLASTAQQGLDFVNLYQKVPPTAITPGPAPTNPLPGTEQSYGPAGVNWNPMVQNPYGTLPTQGPQLPQTGGAYGPAGVNWNPSAPNPLYGPQLPQVGGAYGPAGTNWSGVGY